MKFKHFVIATVILALAFIISIIVFNWNKSLIFLSSGKVIEADKAWVVLDEVYYEKGAGTLFTVKTKTVDKVVRGNLSGVYGWKDLILYQIASGEGVFKIFKEKIFVYGVASIIGFFIFLSLIRLLLSKRKKSDEEADDEEESISINISPGIDDEEKIVLFFLNIFLQQSQARRQDRYHYRRTDVEGPLKTTVYEFRLNIDGQWSSRRMSLGRIGETSGARSKCFYVIFDDHYVVKIPPEPVTNIQKYTENIKAERRVAEVLAPRQCLAPKVSIILKQIPSYIKAVGTGDADDEKRCLNGLSDHIRFHKFLKIGESFVFFMDLSRHYFLGQVLTDCHNGSQDISKEIKTSWELIWSSHEFTDRYGEAAYDLSLKLQSFYDQFEKYFDDTSVAAYQKKAWFRDRVLMDQAVAKSKDIPLKARKILDVIKQEQKTFIEDYHAHLKMYSGKRVSRQNVGKIQCICSNLVDMLAWLFFKNVAIRDLKPDNILVAGDPSKYPHFLNSTDDFEIGLIDVEIAALLNPNPAKISQPNLGWTPYYATASHMFTNDILGKIFNDVRLVFFLQDWYAVVAIIYQAITGRRLFGKTAGTLVGFSKKLSQYYHDDDKMIEFARQANAAFWTDATKEFESVMKKDQSVLQSISLVINRDVIKMFRRIEEQSGHMTAPVRLSEIRTGISAYDLLSVMFLFIRKGMTVG